MALDFDGVNQDVDPGNAAGLDGQFPMTIALWMNHDEAATDYLVMRGREGTSGWNVYIASGGELHFVKAGVRDDPSVGLAFPTGVWVFAAVSLAASNDMRFVKITAAGVVSSSTVTVNANFTGTPTESCIAIGRTSAGAKTSSPYNGKLAHVVKLNAALTNNELVTLAFTLRSPAKAFWMPLGVSSPEVDWSGGGASGTRTNAPAVYANPGHGPLFGYDSEWAGAFTAAAGGDTLFAQAVY